jgi:hypothetical protein
VPAGGSRRGRRDNGLSAAEYAAVGDVDPRVGEHLLDVLAGDGIAAYLLPATDLHPVTRTTTLPARPTDRLYADRAHLGTAKAYLARLRADEAAAAGAETLAGGTAAEPTDAATARADDDIDVEAAWASIIAGYDAEINDKTPPWPATENVSTRAPDDTDPDLEPRLDLDEVDLIAAADDEPEPSDPLRSSLDETSLLDALYTL